MIAKTPWAPSLGYITFKRTYARRLKEDELNSPTEEFEQTIDRVLDACDTQLKVGFTPQERARAKKYFLDLKGSVAGRFWWQLGTDTVERLGLPSLQNCAFTVVDEPVRPFTWTMDMLMLGSGVGFNIQREYVYKLPKVREDFVPPVRQDNASADFILPDTRAGWVKLLELTLKGAFYKDEMRGFTFSTQLIRGKGAPIKGFGGVSSGPDELVKGMLQLAGVIQARAGKQLRPIDCLDIMNILGQIVVSGNVRRSAQIAIGDADDLQYLSAKNWRTGKIPNWRANSNNSVVCNDIANLPKEFWKTYEGGSEPYGLINLKLARSCGRIGETQYKDKGVMGFNPCAEQPLEPYETCCLAELFLPNIKSLPELVDVAKYLYRIAKHSLMLPCHHKETEEIVHKNMRMGIGVTGYLQATDEQREWLKDAYTELREFDKEYSKKRGWPESIKLTTVKPSGTLSLLPGVTPGVHPGYAQYMIRRIRVASDSSLVELCKKNGYFVEFVRNFDGSDDHNTMVIEFPFAYPEGTVLAKDLTALDQLEWVKKLQTEWSDNAVSCTVYYRPEELDTIKEYLDKNYNKNFKSLSFLLHEDHGFPQAPFEEITKEKYDEIVKKVKPITKIEDELTLDISAECAGGVCPVR